MSSLIYHHNKIWWTAPHKLWSSNLWLYYSLQISVSLRCNSCYNHTTNQRNYDLLDIPLNIQPQRSTMEGDKLIIACKSW